MASEGIVIVTSIPPAISRRDNGRPVGEAYQRRCIQSWAENGFRILSVNDKSEIADLAARYPQVEFVTTDRNAGALSGRKNPYIADLLSALMNAPERVTGIVNSDILFEPCAAWREQLPNLVRNAVVTGQRRDTASLQNGVFGKYFYGFDYFFFEREAVAKATEWAGDFAMGLPWWDYWLPLAMALQGRKIVALDRPAVLHLEHGNAYQESLWLRFGGDLAEFILKSEKEFVGTMAERAMPFIAAARRLSEFGKAGDAENTRLAIAGLSTVLSELIQKDAMRLECTSPNDDAFCDVDERTEVGAFFDMATELDKNRRFDEAAKLYERILARYSEDAVVLAQAGRNAHRRRDFAKAVELLSRAAEIDSDNAGLSVSLGLALAAAGNPEQGTASFERALETNPQEGSAYYYLALARLPEGRHREVVTRFEAALGVNPSPANAEWLRLLHQELNRHGA